MRLRPHGPTARTAVCKPFGATCHPAGAQRSTGPGSPLLATNVVAPRTCGQTPRPNTNVDVLARWPPMFAHAFTAAGVGRHELFHVSAVRQSRS
jgi:hypothetical protein